MKVTTTLGSLEIIDSGIIIIDMKEEIAFYLSADEEDPLTVHVKFQKDDNKEKPRIATEVLSDYEINIILHNLTMSGGTSEPILLGEAQGRELYFSFRVEKKSEIVSIFHYNWFLGNEVVNGKN